MLSLDSKKFGSPGLFIAYSTAVVICKAFPRIADNTFGARKLCQREVFVGKLDNGIATSGGCCVGFENVMAKSQSALFRRTVLADGALQGSAIRDDVTFPFPGLVIGKMVTLVV